MTTKTNTEVARDLMRMLMNLYGFSSDPFPEMGAQYVAKALAVRIEDCAKICDAEEASSRETSGRPRSCETSYETGRRRAARKCAEFIRRLNKPESAQGARVYLVMRCVKYEGSDVVAMYASRDAAEARARSLKEAPAEKGSDAARADVSFEVEEDEVIQ